MQLGANVVSKLWGRCGGTDDTPRCLRDTGSMTFLSCFVPRTEPPLELRQVSYDRNVRRCRCRTGVEDCCFRGMGVISVVARGGQWSLDESEEIPPSRWWSSSVVGHSFCSCIMGRKQRPHGIRTRTAPQTNHESMLHSAPEQYARTFFYSRGQNTGRPVKATDRPMKTVGQGPRYHVTWAGSQHVKLDGPGQGRPTTAVIRFGLATRAIDILLSYICLPIVGHIR